MNTQSLLQKFSILIIAVWMLAGALGHFFRPEFFYPIVPDFLASGFLTKRNIVLLTGVPELLIGLGILWPRTRALAGLMFALLCLAFLPLHLWDLVRDDPAITPHIAAIIRVFIQFILIWIGWKVWKRGGLK